MKYKMAMPIHKLLHESFMIFSFPFRCILNLLWRVHWKAFLMYYTQGGTKMVAFAVAVCPSVYIEQTATENTTLVIH